jgi:NAD(P)H-dependent flavin oxidoreductase YrpB (nitropropane dioxygenase family)
MTITTAFTELLGCAVPIQAAGMGAASTPALTVAVSNAGGLGMLAATDDDRAADIDAVPAAAPGRPFGVNFLMPLFDRAVLDAVAPHVPLVEWYWAWPDPVLVSVAHNAGALAAWQVGSVEEARAAADAGCDLIVAQGIGAGGHAEKLLNTVRCTSAENDAANLTTLHQLTPRTGPMARSGQQGEPLAGTERAEEI